MRKTNATNAARKRGEKAATYLVKNVPGYIFKMLTPNEVRNGRLKNGTPVMRYRVERFATKKPKDHVF